jgi:hypothetical protein
MFLGVHLWLRLLTFDEILFFANEQLTFDELNTGK